MEVSPPRPSIRLRLKYPAFPEPCPEEPLREQLEELWRENRELREKLDQSRTIATKLRSRVREMDSHVKALHTSVNAQVRAAKSLMKDRQYELVRQTTELFEMLRRGGVDMSQLKVERRLRYTREKERDLAREQGQSLSLALSRAEAQLQAQETQLSTLQARVEAHTLTRAELGEALGAAKAATARERLAAQVAKKTSAAALATGEQLRQRSESAAVERDEALGQARAAEQLAESVSCAAKEQQGELEIAISALTQNSWQLSKLPERRNWCGISAASERVYRSNDVNALVEILTSREWRAHDICTALSKSWYERRW